MATKSFQREFIFNKKTADALAEALENSRRVDIKLNRKAEYITDSKKIHAELDDVFKNIK
ncbi:hypothetical protein [Ligilactobacillus aviarius]|uniref:Uncharacterized protein n=1 Tax=Ligilactobacillus aviarius TaxID=1606 RepID=A0A179C8H6_9LACO|nr:hypothetical protein [Ligilactobacillus aviarius]OAP97420.1 hypothetical protein A3O07_00995 [Ligilactobacillus aviarius]OAQ00909.1 hypothetical protein A3O09_03835 [Ligilactobacillus aviarius]OAQ01174.1 hypothetical protein A3O08_02720 [Ligilactobacillus aviarius]OAQ06072.1 hypothetical protein A3O13_02085 [Ligilactobacillus aviarius]OAQ08709.1 hypothetical protein A3O14_03235 [Ligilactobacillus aviarius]